jgi:DNA-binding GntR family transcriptional regulator
MVSSEPRQPYQSIRVTTGKRPLRADGVGVIEAGLETGSNFDSFVPSRPVERAYEAIRQGILTGILKPGDHLREESLAAMSGTSRTPVREALRRLVAEGLATGDGRQRYVTDFTDEEVVIVFEIRAKIESYATGVAAQKITDDEIRRLERLIAEIDEIDVRGGAVAVSRFLALNDEFHAMIVAASRSRQLKLLTAHAVSLPLVLMKQFVWEQHINVSRSNAQHRDIVAALSARNSEWAATAMAGHILSTKPRPGDAHGAE